ncbi:CSC1-like protein At3g54510 isoform X3 [Beta vulgaris subsp. vulgaris]|uniref:CSC1-like protein At3g54510 isoform X3 n=1 Tax=Beta vulgaris subsp. vulgaris TaxID=3555 RepID=UPI002036A9B0|nr:CSC1-like protein At3g54510 isoform X3 [Beta vulgaris subsp. vulgaris]
MSPEGLLASAAINIGLAMAVLCIFSILKKQPSNSFIYYARRLANNDQQQQSVTFDGFSFRRFLPSVSWFPRALRVPEDDILRNFGLDALIIIRLFKFGIRFFVVCSVIGLLILVPLNYYSQPSQPNHSHYMNSFTISNIRAGSNRLWVHFSCLWFISFYGLYMLYKEYAEILAKRTLWLHNLKDRPDYFTILVREIPLCTEHRSYGCSVYHFFTRHYQHSFQSYQMLYDGRDLDLLHEQATSIQRKIEQLREKSMKKKSNNKGFLIEPLRGDDSKISVLEEKLHRLCEVICGMQHETVLQQMELPAAFVTFKSRVGAALAAQSQQHPNPFMWITEQAQEPRDLLWKNLSTPSRRLLLYKIGFFLAATLLTIFFAVPVAAVQGIAKFERLRKWFPPAMAVQLIPGLRSVVTGYLPSLILNGFIYIVPYSLLGIAKLTGYSSRSQTEIKVCNMVFYFLVGNVFFLSLLSGSLLDELGESFSHPGDFPSRLARAVAAQADFFTTYILSDGLSGFSLEILQAGLLTWDAIKRHTFGRGKKRSPYLYSLPYFRVIPFVCLCLLIGMVYALVAPLLLPFVVGYLYIGYAVYMNQIEDVYPTVYETCGQYWPYVHSYIFFALILMQITMVGLFGLKSKPGALVATLPLVVFTLLFNEYCKLRFLPSFSQNTIQLEVTYKWRTTWSDSMDHELLIKLLNICFL